MFFRVTDGFTLYETPGHGPDKISLNFYFQISFFSVSFYSRFQPEITVFKPYFWLGDCSLFENATKTIRARSPKEVPRTEDPSCRGGWRTQSRRLQGEASDSQTSPSLGAKSDSPGASPIWNSNPGDRDHGEPRPFRHSHSLSNRFCQCDAIPGGSDRFSNREGKALDGESVEPIGTLGARLPRRS